MEQQVVSVYMSPIWSLGSPQSIYKAPQTSSKVFEADGMLSLNDILILHQDRDQLHQITQSACQLLECLGLLVNNKKSLLTPCQQLEFLGFQLCTQTLRMLVPLEKMRKIQQDATRILAQDQVWLREIARFVGKVVALV